MRGGGGCIIAELLVGSRLSLFVSISLSFQVNRRSMDLNIFKCCFFFFSYRKGSWKCPVNEGGYRGLNGGVSIYYMGRLTNIP